MKLHLGCGQRYFKGYVNIDFPASEHTVMKDNAADMHTDILSLNYKPESIEEVRLHHVFEHFTRPTACALLAGWNSWLKSSGILHIEVPDFQKTARVMLSMFSSMKSKFVAERHLFGSHEASWAVHCDGYTPKTLKFFIEQFGFKTLKIIKNSWLGTYNFEIIAEKTNQKISLAEFEQITKKYLTNFMVSETAESEIKLLNTWLEMYSKQICKNWAK